MVVFSSSDLRYSSPLNNLGDDLMYTRGLYGGYMMGMPYYGGMYCSPYGLPRTLIPRVPGDCVILERHKKESDSSGASGTSWQNILGGAAGVVGGVLAFVFGKKYAGQILSFFSKAKPKV